MNHNFRHPSDTTKTHAQLLAEVDELRNQLAESQDELARLKTQLPEAEKRHTLAANKGLTPW